MNAGGARAAVTSIADDISARSPAVMAAAFWFADDSSIK